jgi:hypothetical protein
MRTQVDRMSRAFRLGRELAAKAGEVPTRRVIHPQVRILDEKAGLCEYIASDETIDSYREVIRADGWRFDRFSKNAPFVDSHDYSTVENCVGKVIDFKVAGKQLVETVKWAIDVPQNQLATLGWNMTKAGYLRAVSVGFQPTQMLSRWDRDPQPFNEMCESMGLDPKSINAIYTEQQQLELSACVIGANPNALAKSYKAGLLDDAMLERISAEHAKRETATLASESSAALVARQRKREEFLRSFERLTKAV